MSSATLRSPPGQGRRSQAGQADPRNPAEIARPPKLELIERPCSGCAEPTWLEERLVKFHGWFETD